MRNRLLVAVLVGGWVVGLGGGVVWGAMTIEKVVPVATDHDVRVRVEVTGDSGGEVEVEGKIVPAGGGGKVLWEGALGKVAVRGGGKAAVERVVGG